MHIEPEDHDKRDVDLSKHHFLPTLINRAKLCLSEKSLCDSGMKYTQVNNKNDFVCKGSYVSAMTQDSS